MKIFNTCLALAHKFRHVLTLCALLLVLFVVAGWIYLDEVRDATTKTTYTWLSDTTHVITEPIDPNSEFRQTFTTADPIFGGGFVFTIYDEICHGTVTLELQDEQGQVLASHSMLGIDLYDNTFQQMPFPDGVFPNGETTYDFVIRFTPDVGNTTSQLGLWVSEEPSDTLPPYVLNGETATTCASFALVTNYAGTFVIKAFFACVLFAALALVVGYTLLFWVKATPTVIFAFCSITLGLLYMMAIPPYVAPDETNHIHTAYHLSNTLLGIPNEGTVSLRADDNIAFDRADEWDVFSYQTVAHELFGQCQDATMIPTDHKVITSEPFYTYLPTAIGVTLARLCNFNYMTLLYFGRITNLLCYTALVTLAIWLMPQYKRMIVVVGLLPMSLQLAASFNYDAVVLSVALVYTALVLHTASHKGNFSWKQLVLVAVVGLLLAPMKKLYVFLCLFCCILSLKRCPKLVQTWFWKVVALGVISFFCLIPSICKALWITPEFIAISRTMPLPEFNPMNIDYENELLWLPLHILTHLTSAIKVMLRTVEVNTGLYLTQLIGGKAGEYILRDLPIWTPLIGVFYVVLFLSVVPCKHEKTLLTTAQKCWGGVLILATVGGLFTVCLTWTPMRLPTIWGLQGRYLLPIVPLTLLVLQQQTLILRKNIEHTLYLTAFFGNLLAIASVFQQAVGT